MADALENTRPAVGGSPGSVHKKSAPAVGEATDSGSKKSAPAVGEVGSLEKEARQQEKEKARLGFQEALGEARLSCCEAAGEAAGEAGGEGGWSRWQSCSTS